MTRVRSACARSNVITGTCARRTRRLATVPAALVITLLPLVRLCQAVPPPSGSAHSSNANVPPDHNHSASPSLMQNRPVQPSTGATGDNGQFGRRLAMSEELFRRLSAEAKSGNSRFWVTPTFTLLGVILGAGIKSLFDIALASKRAKFETASSIVQWELRQLSELYGPLRALLRESHALYRQMNGVLAQSDPNKFRFSPTKRESRDGQDFEIFVSNSWVGFRAILHAEEVYGHGYGVEEYFDALVATGARMKKIIEEKAGYIQQDQPTLGDVFGRYLAHYSVLERLHSYYKSGKSSSGPIPVALANSAVFPSEIDALVESGFNAICNELNAWRSKGRN